MVLGRVFHYTFDAILVSTVLAGIRRTTGLTPKRTDENNKEVNSFIGTYLDVGEKVFDMSVVLVSSSGYFERKR